MKIETIIALVGCLILFIILLIVILTSPILTASAAPLPETEFTTHRKIDNELGIVCYTTVMLKDKEISELTMSCVPLPATCNYGERMITNEQ